MQTAVTDQQEGVSHRRLEIAMVLLNELGASVNLKNEHGRTALHLAAFRGNSDMCSLLVERGADTGIRNANGMTAAEEAVASGHTYTAEALGWAPVEESASSGNWKEREVDRLAQDGSDELREARKIDEDRGNDGSARGRGRGSPGGMVIRLGEEGLPKGEGEGAETSRRAFNTHAAKEGRDREEEAPQQEEEEEEGLQAEEGRQEGAELRAHVNPSLHPLIVCASPLQREAIPQVAHADPQTNSLTLALNADSS
eukprot:2238103-Rhodomonas_salina.2